MAIEICFSPPRGKEFLSLPPEIQFVGMHFILAVYESLNIHRSGIVVNEFYPGLSKRRKTIEFLSKKYITVADFPIIDEFKNAIAYLVLETRPGTLERFTSESSKPEISMALNRNTTDSPAKVSQSARDVQSLLDNRDGKALQSDVKFISFMRQLSNKRDMDDWDGARILISNERQIEKHIDILLVHAAACSLEGIKSLDLPWSPEKELDASGFVKLAAMITATRQGKKKAQKALFDKATRIRILEIWSNLYLTALKLTGAMDDQEPAKHKFAEIVDKNTASLGIADVLQDPVLMAYSTLAGAWMMLRIGNKNGAEALRSKLSPQLKWPPIKKEMDGEYIYAFPPRDFLGNEIPNSLTVLSENDASIR